ncbi:hypothetical protein, partial [Pantanalinema sp. GBBB05]|uniref:hypothetical protein n=1 Tax=Pantanalinema sp. GBBB05 TaxID=2604139 RepID=UPI003D815C06
LEDHTRKVIQQLWLEILAELSQGNSALDYSLIADKLAWRIGSSTAPDPAIANPEPDRSREMPPDASRSNLHPLLQDVPLFTPLFAEERFVVQQFLERLRNQGWLKPIEWNHP